MAKTIASIKDERMRIPIVSVSAIVLRIEARTYGPNRF